MEIVSIDDEIINQAEKKAISMVCNGLYNRFDKDTYTRVENAKTGIVGELAFEEFLKEHGINYNIDDITDYKYSNKDLFDFEINGKIIDIKVAKLSTSNKPHDNWTYGYPEDQNPLKKDIIIIGLVDYKNKNVSFYGWITGEKVSNFKVVMKNSFANYNYQTPNHEFKYSELDKNILKMLKELV